MQDFRKLKVWERAHQLTLAAYTATAAFPRDEVYTLTAQMRRAALSVPTNIAEGCGRGSNADLVRFLYIALGSLTELDYQLQLANELGYLATSHHDDLRAHAAEVRRMLIALISRIQRATPKRATQKTQNSEPITQDSLR